MKDLEALVMSVTGSKAKNVCREELLQFLVHNVRGLVDTKWELLRSGTAPPLCLPSVYLLSLHVTVTGYPRPSPSIFAHCKQSTTCIGDENSLRTRLGNV